MLIINQSLMTCSRITRPLLLFQESLEIEGSCVGDALMSVQALTSIYQMYKSLQVSSRDVSRKQMSE